MVQMNASKKARYSSSISNFNQGGGNKKAGFPYQVGRSWRTSIAFGAVDPVHGHCCNLGFLRSMRFPLAHISRPIGRNNAISYWNIPGTGM
jgi:hypothetical protein